MSLFGNILEKLGLKHPAATAPSPSPQVPPAAQPGASVSSPPPEPPHMHPGMSAPISPQGPPLAQQVPPAPAPAQPAPSTPPTVQQVPPATPPNIAPPPPSSSFVHPEASPAAAAPTPIPMVDVVGKLTQMAAANPQHLDWKVSIVDLLKLLGLPNTYADLKELAVELGCPPEYMHDSAQMNTWLHKTVLQKLAENGGNIPKEMLD
jgi:hypothetical protein